jgi:hypothetical protein
MSNQTLSLPITYAQINENEFEIGSEIINGDNVNIFVIASVKDIDDQQCCEKASIKYVLTDNEDKWEETELDPDDFIGAIVTGVEYDENKIQIQIHFQGRDTLIIIPENDHNGYYPHTFVIEFNKKIFQVEVGKNPIDLNNVAQILEKYEHRL